MRQDHVLLRWLLFPLSLVFGLVVALKNTLYKVGVFNGVRFNVPVISVGNLTVGGAGKTPHVEYLIRLLRPYIRVSVLSRGFGRSTSGFLLVRPEHQSRAAGDEPLMFARKYRDISIAVSESRSLGIPLLLQHHPDLQVVLLDDAFQHQSVSPHLNILLTEFDNPFYRDWLLPTGSLREWRSGYHRADVIIVSKCPMTLTEEDRYSVLQKIQPHIDQKVYFSAYRYHHPYAMFARGARVTLTANHSVLLVCGIARTEYLLDYVSSCVGYLDLLQFGDHHTYRPEDIDLIANRYAHLPGENDNKIILTTEKDSVRLEAFGSSLTSQQLPVFLLPVEVVFLYQDGALFDNYIHQFLLNFKV